MLFMSGCWLKAKTSLAIVYELGIQTADLINNLLKGLLHQGQCKPYVNWEILWPNTLCMLNLLDSITHFILKYYS